MEGEPRQETTSKYDVRNVTFHAVYPGFFGKYNILVTYLDTELIRNLVRDFRHPIVCQKRKHTNLAL